MDAKEARQLRESTGCTVNQWAELLGVHQRTIRNIECGTTPATRGGKALMLAWRLLAEKHTTPHTKE